MDGLKQLLQLLPFLLLKRICLVGPDEPPQGPKPLLSCSSYRVFCLMSDGESSEGSVWEAMAFASYYSLDNLVAIFDVNRLGHSGALPAEHCIDIYQRRCEAFG